MRRYFVSDQAENEATAQVVYGYQKANEAKAKHEGRLKALGDSLAIFAGALRDPGKYQFAVDDTSYITVGNHGDDSSARPTVQITPADLDWKALCESLLGYINARQDKQAAADRFRNMGIRVVPD